MRCRGSIFLFSLFFLEVAFDWVRWAAELFHTQGNVSERLFAMLGVVCIFLIWETWFERKVYVAILFLGILTMQKIAPPLVLAHILVVTGAFVIAKRHIPTVE